MTARAVPLEPADLRRPWGRATLWLAALAPFFYLTYGAANHLASVRADVPSVVFDWERGIPFMPWTIVPYWSINLLYGLSLFVCVTRDELDRHGLRLLTAQVVAVVCFVLFPLRFSFPAPPAGGGLPGFLFEALRSFDQPFNQAPSLHIALLVILWALYRRHVPAWTRPVLHVWFALIGLSVLTTWQHHAIDIPTGALLGVACLWLWPDAGRTPVAEARLSRNPRRLRLAALYAAGSAALAASAVGIGGAGLLLWWPAISTAFVAASYALLGPQGFQKRPDGTMPVAARWLYAPYLLAAFLNSRMWTRKNPAPAEIADGVWLGRFPGRRDHLLPTATVIDMSAELPRNLDHGRWRSFPLLDLATPDSGTLRAAAAAIEEARRSGAALVCCALGFSRSAAAVATWMVATGRAGDARAAAEQIRHQRPGIVLSECTLLAVDAAAGRTS